MSDTEARHAGAALFLALEPRTPEVRMMLSDAVERLTAELPAADLWKLADAVEHGYPGSMELAEQAGLSYRRLHLWTQAGYLQPVDPRPGSGYRSHYRPSQVAKAHLMARLTTDYGMDPEHASSVADDMMRDGRATRRGFTLTRGTS